MRASLPTAEARIKKVDVKKFNIEGFDIDNAYPQRMIELVNACSTAKSCVGIYSDFINGQGFKDLTFYKAKVNPKLTLDQLLRRTADDYSLHRGVAVWVNYNALFQKVSLQYVPFEHCRLGIEENAGKIVIYNDWGLKKRIDTTAIKVVELYNPDPEVIQAQVDAAGGWDNYNGQIFWLSADYETYPLASCDAVIEPMLAEIASDITTTNNLKNNFQLKYRIKRSPEFESDTERQAYLENYKKFFGESGSTVAVEDGNVKEDFPEFEKIETSLNDKLFEYTDEKVTKKIIRNYKQPPALHGVMESGMLNSQQMEDVFKYYNGITKKDRILFEEIFFELTKNFPAVNPSEVSQVITPLSYADNGN